MKRIIALLAISIFGASSAFAASPTTYTGKVIKVTDGDTIKVDNNGTTETIRILGLDTPEKFATRTGYKECFGDEASKRAEELLSGATVKVEYYNKDKYARDLADVYVNGKLFALTIVEEGYGYVYKSGLKTSNYKRLLMAERKAKAKKIGLWGKDTCNGKRSPVVEKQKETLAPVALPANTPSVPSSNSGAIENADTKEDPVPATAVDTTPSVTNSSSRTYLI